MPKDEKKPQINLELDEVYREIGFCRIKDETDEQFKERVSLHVDREKWFKLGKKAMDKLQDYLDGTIDADATDIAIIRTVLERLEGEPKKKISLEGPGGGPIQIANIPITPEQLARFVKNHAETILESETK